MDKYAKMYKAGAVLFQEGEPGSEVHVIQLGRVQLTKRIFRTSVVVEDIGKGDFCGELALVMKTTRPVTATVIEDARMLVVPAEQFETMIAQSSAITMQMLKRLATRLTRTQFRLSNFALRQPMGRMLHQLRAEWKVASLQGNGGVPLLPDDLAEALGMEMGEVTKILEKAVADRLVDIDDQGVFHIPNPESFDRFLTYLELRDRYEFVV